MARASGVGNLPYTPYGGELTAPINAQQQQGIGAINQGAGFAQPYIQQAHDYAAQAATPLTQQQIQQYQSPYTQSVVDATMRQFNNQNQQQQQNVIGNAAAQGALGGDRVGVAQANLASQQQMAQAPIIAGLYDKSYQSGLGVAQQQQQNMGNAAYSMGNLGVAGQNAALSGANAQVGAGNLLQGNEQQRMNAAYQQFMLQQAFPYQQTQWLAGVNSGLGSLLGGTSETTAPAPNPWGQVAGGALTAAAMFARDGGRIHGFAPGGGVSGTPYGGVGGFVPMIDITRGRGAPDAPRVGNQQQPGGDWGKAAGNFAGRMATRDWSSPLDISPAGGSAFTPSGVGSIYPMTGPTSGGLGPIYADGGFVRGYDDGGFIPGFAPGGDVDTFADRFGAANDAIASGAFDPQGANYMGPAYTSPPDAIPVQTTSLRPSVSDAGVMPLPRPRPEEAPQMTTGMAPPPVGEEEPQVASQDAQGFAADDTGGDVMQPGVGASADSAGPKKSGLLGLIPDNLRLPLMQAGLAMMASRSPHLGNAIGEGGLAGVGAYTRQEENKLAHEEKRTGLAQQNRRIDLEARRLDEAAKRAQRVLAETTRRNDIADRRADTAERRADLPPGYRWNADRTAQEFIPGGVADPAVQKAAADAKRGAAGLLDDETIGTMAGQYLSGDKSVMQNLGRGAQGAENIVKLRAEITRQAREQGLKPDQIATKMADFAGRTAAMRTLGTRGVNVEYAANTANRAIDLAQEASEKVPRTQFVPFNELKRLYETKMSSPEQAAFYAATNTLVNEYARVASGGSAVATEGMRHHAREMLNTAQGPEAYKAVLNMMRREIKAAKAAYNETRQEFLQDTHARDEKAGAGAAPEAGTPKVGERKQFKQGWGVWDGTKWAPEKP